MTDCTVRFGNYNFDSAVQINWNWSSHHQDMDLSACKLWWAEGRWHWL